MRKIITKLCYWIIRKLNEEVWKEANSELNSALDADGLDAWMDGMTATDSIVWEKRESEEVKNVETKNNTRVC